MKVNSKVNSKITDKQFEFEVTTMDNNIKWLDNITNILNINKAGKCPYCGKENTDYRLLEISNGNGYGNIWCNDCKRAYHLSLIKVSKKI